MATVSVRHPMSKTSEIHGSPDTMCWAGNHCQAHSLCIVHRLAEAWVEDDSVIRVPKHTTFASCFSSQRWMQLCMKRMLLMTESYQLTRFWKVGLFLGYNNQMWSYEVLTTLGIMPMILPHLSPLTTIIMLIQTYRTFPLCFCSFHYLILLLMFCTSAGHRMDPTEAEAIWCR
jgi:hypothetical protein